MRQGLFVIFLLLGTCLCERAAGSDTDTERAESEYRQFTDKRSQQVEARIVSISDDLRLLNLEGRDGRKFELAITMLSLDDQQFLREWLYPSATKSSGEAKVFGFLPGERPIDVDALTGVDDIVSIHAFKQGWMVLRESGDVLSFGERFAGLTDVAQLSVNTVWVYVTYKNGKVGGATGKVIFPELISDVIQGAGGNGHGAVVLPDGSVKVWGRDYGSQEPIDPPKPLSDIIQLAANQDRMAALRKDGRVFSWISGKPEVFDAILGDGAVEIEGSIFDCLGLTRSGEVYAWNRADLSTARIPPVLEGKGPFQKVRCNGATRAAQKEDGSWIASDLAPDGYEDLLGYPATVVICQGKHIVKNFPIPREVLRANNSKPDSEDPADTEDAQKAEDLIDDLNRKILLTFLELFKAKPAPTPESNQSTLQGSLPGDSNIL